MIGSLKGLVMGVYPPHLLVEVQGVGYEVMCSQRTLQAFGAVNTPVHLMIETHLRTDALCLYGFETQEERQWFRLLQTVPGVGAKVAMALLSLYPPQTLAQHILQNQQKQITMADGVGAKLATRMISELKDKVGSLGLGVPSSGMAHAVPTMTSVAHEVVSALTHLGYRPFEAEHAVSQALRALEDAKESPTFDTLMRQSLKMLSTPVS